MPVRLVTSRRERSPRSRLSSGPISSSPSMASRSFISRSSSWSSMMSPSCIRSCEQRRARCACYIAATWLLTYCYIRASNCQ